MKKTLLAALFFTVVGIISARAQSQTYTAPINRPNHTPKHAPVTTQPRAIGAFPRVSRNPLQLLNPRAPQRYYGPPQETVVYETENYEANHHPRINGLILFGLAW
ncbi:MAG: hypothetical protein M3R10_00930 [Verrucomicrobiota bacterium]|nr:hypothetical protein [Verrucomicrobiota bacterium]